MSCKTHRLIGFVPFLYLCHQLFMRAGVRQIIVLANHINREDSTGIRVPSVDRSAPFLCGEVVRHEA